MTERIRPTEFRDAMDIARAVTDDRTEFDVYMNIARKLVRAELRTPLSELSVSDRHKRQIVEAEAYSRAQPAHLRDASTYEPTELLSMLDKLLVF